MDWIGTLSGRTRAELLRLAREGARSIAELADALGITDNAVRTHIAALERDGMVRVAGVHRATGGKPARLYELTPEAEELYPKAYALVFTEVLSALREERGEEAVLDLLRRVGRRLGAASAAAGTGDGRRVVDAAAAVLESIGGTVAVRDREDGWEICATGCPLSAIVSESPDACALAEALVAQVTGLAVRETCDRTGRPRCAFQIQRSA